MILFDKLARIFILFFYGEIGTLQLFTEILRLSTFFLFDKYKMINKYVLDKGDVQ